jgi:superfamily I DNA/RNA helicase
MSNAMEEAFARAGVHGYGPRQVGRQLRPRPPQHEPPDPTIPPENHGISTVRQRVLDTVAEIGAMSEDDLAIEILTLEENADAIRIELRGVVEQPELHERGWQRRAERALAGIKTRLSLCNRERGRRQQAQQALDAERRAERRAAHEQTLIEHKARAEAARAVQGAREATLALAFVRHAKALPMPSRRAITMPDLLFQPSAQQRAFFDFAAGGSGNGVLEASAGAGKTTTLTRGAEMLGGTRFLGAFNRTIAKEMQRRMGTHDHSVHVSTMHAAGFRAWLGRYPKVTVDAGKTRKVFRQLALERRFANSASYLDYVADMVGYAMSVGIGIEDAREIDDDKIWKAVSEHFDADLALDKKTGANEATGIRWAQMTLKRSLELCPEVVNFDEMIYAPVARGVGVQRYDNVLIDEVQDSNLPRICLAERMLAERGRLIGVGDRYQSIYAFAGADAEAMEKVIGRFAAVVMPLSVSFRCPRSVVLYAQQYVGEHIEPAPEAADGVARWRDGRPGWWREEKPGAVDVVLCRFNAPLFALAFELLRDGVPCRMAGRADLGRRLRQLVQQSKSRTLDGLEAHLHVWLDEECRVATLRKKPERANAALDTVETLQIVMDRCRATGQHTADDLLAELARLFAPPDQPALLLSSIHKAKGLEWPRVFWLQKPARFSPQEWQQKQERNLQYVAATRAMRELVLLQA